jgi:predicted RNase H-like nuclease (RuvC/YqgF family)
MDKAKLSYRIRYDSEVADWIHKEIVLLENEIDTLATDYDSQSQYFYQMEHEIKTLRDDNARLIAMSKDGKTLQFTVIK